MVKGLDQNKKKKNLEGITTQGQVKAAVQKPALNFRNQFFMQWTKSWKKMDQTEATQEMNSVILDLNYSASSRLLCLIGTSSCT